jgi:uncharacterized protein YjlB
MAEQAPVGGSTELRRFEDDGRIPNNPKLPLVIYRVALKPSQNLAADFEKRFAENGWTNSWRDGIFDYHHFHSNTHEVLGAAKGEARVCFGGEQGEVLALSTGDIAILPAGTGHKCESASDDFLVVGAYPDGRDFDICRANPAEHDGAVARIAKVPLPRKDPVFGKRGVLVWQDS